MPTSIEIRKRVAVLGADGLIGTHLVPALEASDLEAVPVIDYRRPGSSNGARSYDPTDAASVAASVEGCFAVIAAEGWVPRGLTLRQARRQAIRRARALTDGARAAGAVRTVFVSHVSTLEDLTVADGASFHLPGTSDNIVVEARWSFEAEIYRAIKEGADIPVVIPGMALGPGDERGDATLMVELLRERWPALPDGRIEIVDARDLARSLVQAVTSGRSGRRYPVCAANIELQDLLTAIERVRPLGRRPRLVSREIPLAAARLAEIGLRATGREVALEASLAQIRRGRVRDKKARGELSFVARPLQNTLQDAVRWYEQAFGWTT